MSRPVHDTRDTSLQLDQVVGVHYSDPARAEGLARLYDAETPLGAFYRDRMWRIAALLEGLQGDLLDAGCGTGQMLRFLRDSCGDRLSLTGLDRSESMIEVARNVVDDAYVRLTVGRIEQMPFASSAFDVVLAMGSLEYVSNMDEAIAEIARVTRPGGLAIVTMQNRWSPYRLWDATVWSRVRRRRGAAESPIVRRLRERRLRSALETAGFTPRAVLYYGFNLLLPPLDSRFPEAALRLQRIVEPIARGPLRRIATDYIVAARREAHAPA